MALKLELDTNFGVSATDFYHRMFIGMANGKDCVECGGCKVPNGC